MGRTTQTEGLESSVLMELTGKEAKQKNTFYYSDCFFFLAAPGLSCGIWDLVSRPGIKPRPPALGTQSLSH